MFTPASDFETASSRTVTSRDHPPSCNRLWAIEKGYLKVGTPPASVGGGFTESAFCASIAGFFGTGSLRLRSPCAFWAESCPSPAALFAAIMPAASAAELAPRNPRRVQRSFSDSSAISTASLLESPASSFSARSSHAFSFHFHFIISLQIESSDTLSRPPQSHNTRFHLSFTSQVS